MNYKRDKIMSEHVKKFKQVYKWKKGDNAGEGF